MADENNAELVERMRTELAQVQDRIAVNQEALDRLDDGATEVTSSDSCVTVRTSADGRVTAVQLADRAMRMSAEALSEAITKTMRQAVASAPDDVANVASNVQEGQSDSGAGRGGCDEIDDDGPLFTGLF